MFENWDLELHWDLGFGVWKFAMLRLRICPNCQEEIYSQKAYFCHRCGAELPPPPEIEKPSRAETKPKVKEEKKKARVSKLLIIITTTIFFAALAIVGNHYFRYFSKIELFPPPSPPPPKNETFVADISFEVANHPFSAKGLSEVVPADVDLYLESIDPEILLPSLISPEDWSKIQSVFSEKLGLSVSEAASFLEDEFAVVQEATASAFLARARDVDFLEQKIAEVGEYNSWQAKVVEGILVISNSPDLIRRIEEAQKKLTLNLSLTPGFAEARKKLPKTGQIFYYGKKRLDFIPDSIKGKAFVVSKKDGGVIITGL